MTTQKRYKNSITSVAKSLSKSSKQKPDLLTRLKETKTKVKEFI